MTSGTTADIPDAITHPGEARAALLAYARTLAYAGPPLHLGGADHIKVPFRTAEQLLRDLSGHSDLGPCVRVSPDAGPSKLLGHTKPPAGRTVVSLRLPDRRADTYGEQLVAAMATATAGAHVAASLANRCAEVASRTPGGRQAGVIRAEGAELRALADELAITTVELAPLFLDRWRTEQAARTPAPTVPPVRQVALRNV